MNEYKEIKNIALIGAGGGGSMILGALAPAYNVTIVDGDKYEDKNLGRQIHCRGNDYKVDVLAEVYGGGNKNITAIPAMLQGDEALAVDLIISCVDSNEGRRAAVEMARDVDVPLIICQNETWDPQAWLWLPEHQFNPEINPVEKYNLLSLEEEEQHCNTPERVEEEPQLPAANFVSAAFGVSILQSLVSCNKSKNLIMELKSTPWPVKTVFLKDLTGE